MPAIVVSQGHHCKNRQDHKLYKLFFKERERESSTECLPAAMDETAATTKPDWPTKAAATGERTEDSCGGGEYPGYDVECDGEAWSTLSRSFRQAQTVLDENRALIEEVNGNHESKIPDNMAKNVGLIRQINGNISKLLTIYSDLSSTFSSIVCQRRDAAAVSGKDRGGAEAGRPGDSAERVPEKSE